MKFSELFIDNKTGSARLAVNTQDVIGALRTALMAGFTTLVTTLLLTLPSLPPHTISSGAADLTPVIVAVSSFILRLLLQAISHNK